MARIVRCGQETTLYITYPLDSILRAKKKEPYIHGGKEHTQTSQYTMM